jgi:DNA-binding response OmpR family regulator
MALKQSRAPYVIAVDDDPQFLAFISLALKQFGCQVVTMSKEEDFLSAVNESLPDLAIIDLNLGEGLRGFELITKLRKENLATYPIIVMSGDAHESSIGHALELGANDYLVKPPLMAAFLGKIEHYLYQSQLENFDPPKLENITKEHQSARIDFGMRLTEINPAGFVLVCKHLLKKGMSMHLQGPLFAEIFSENVPVLVNVLYSAVSADSEKHEFQVRVELPEADHKRQVALKNWLEKKRLWLDDAY